MIDLSSNPEARAALALDLADLKRLMGDIGQMPPRPPTLRGRLGATPVRIVRRVLFWVWPPLHAAFTVLYRLLERLIRKLTDLEDALAAIAMSDPPGTRAVSELCELRIRLERMEDVQADAWLEVAKLRAEISELQTAGVHGTAESVAKG